MKRNAALTIRLDLEDLNSAFAYHLDHGQNDELIDLFCEDAIYSHGDRISRGRREIAALFAARSAGTPRTSRHLLSGLRIEVLSPGRATGSSCCLTFAADGSPPLPANPLLVADFEDVYVLCPDQRWRFQQRHIRRIFVDPANPSPVGLPQT